MLYTPYSEVESKMEIGGIILIVLAIVSDIYAIDLLKADGRIIYNDCHDALQHGNNKSDFYMVRFNTSEPFEVYCRFGVNGPGIPIMQQKYGSVNFARGWHDYEYGFGVQSSGDFWLGLSRIKTLTDKGYQILAVTLQDWSHDIRTIQYNYFALGPASLRYPLRIGKYVTSHVLPDDFGFSNGMPFATIDRPDANNCAYHQKGGWWYNYCSYTLPTGHYYPYGPYTPAGGFYDGIYYKDWEGFGYSLKYISLELYHIVYCRFGVNGPGIPIMQQKYGSVNFARGWHDYEYGFGVQSSGDFWLGLSRIKTLTDKGYQILAVTLQDWSHDIRTIQYNYFALGPAISRYPLYIGKYVTSHVLPDDFGFSNGMSFATIDRPDVNNCAYHQKGGWWYNYCSFTLPTGHYYPYGPYTPAGGFYDGIYYKDWEGFGYSLKYISLELYHI